MRWLWLVGLVVAFVITEPAFAQVHAPAGGAWYGGHFYKGGQFMPSGAGGFAPMPFMGGGGNGGFAFPVYRNTYRKKTRTQSRTAYRGSSSGDGSSSLSSSDAFTKTLDRALLRTEEAEKSRAVASAGVKPGPSVLKAEADDTEATEPPQTKAIDDAERQRRLALAHANSEAETWLKYALNFIKMKRYDVAVQWLDKVDQSSAAQRCKDESAKLRATIPKAELEKLKRKQASPAAR